MADENILLKIDNVSKHFRVSGGILKAVNGVSLTVVNSKASSFQVAIIPYTYEHTNFHTIQKVRLFQTLKNNKKHSR